MWNLPGPGIKPRSPALTGRFLTTRVVLYLVFWGAISRLISTVARPFHNPTSSVWESQFLHFFVDTLTNCLFFMGEFWAKEEHCLTWCLQVVSEIDVDYVLLLLFSCCLVQLFATPRTSAHQASLSFTISLSLLKLMSIELVMPSNHLLLCHPLLLLPSIFPRIRVFPNELALQIRWPKYWSFSISPSSEYSGLIILYCLLSFFFSCIFVLPCPGKASCWNMMKHLFSNFLGHCPPPPIGCDYPLARSWLVTCLRYPFISVFLLSSDSVAWHENTLAAALGALLGKRHVHLDLEDLKVRLGEMVKASRSLLREAGYQTRGLCQAKDRPQIVVS